MGFVNGAWLCEFLVRQLCIHGEMDAMSLTLKALEQSRLLGFNHSFHEVNYCLKYLKESNYIVEEVAENAAFRDCIERAKKDRRVKNPRRYCSQRIKVDVLLKPAPTVCSELKQYLEEKYRARVAFNAH